MPDSTSTWNSAKTAFDEGRLQDALNQFLLLSPRDSRDAALSFNIGNIYFRLGNPSTAIAYLERAHALSPRSAEIETALELSRQALLSQTGARDLDPSAHGYERVNQVAPLPVFAAVLALACCLSIWKAKANRTRTWLATAFALAVASLATGALAVWTNLSHQAICAETTTLRSGPADSYLELSRLDAGIKVRDVDLSAAPDWAQVRFGPGKIGWVKKSTLLLLE